MREMPCQSRIGTRNRIRRALELLHHSRADTNITSTLTSGNSARPSFSAGRGSCNMYALRLLFTSLHTDDSVFSDQRTS